MPSGLSGQEGKLNLHPPVFQPVEIVVIGNEGAVFSEPPDGKPCGIRS